MQGCVFYVYLCFDFNENSAFLCWGGCRRAYAACVRWVISKMALRWGGETERRRIVENKFLFYFLCVQKLFSSLHKIQINSLMADGLPWRCFSFFSEPRQWYLLGSQWDSHKHPDLYLKYLKLCSQDEQSFNGVGTTWGKWLMTKFSFWGGVTL